MHQACANNNVVRARLLMRVGADLKKTDINGDMMRFVREILPNRVVAHRTTKDATLAKNEIRKDMPSAAIADTAVGYHANLAFKYVREVEMMERVPREWVRLRTANTRRPPFDQIAWDAMRNFVTTHLPGFAAAGGGYVSNSACSS